VRAIKRRAAIKPEAGYRRIILIYQMEKMLQASADALLKLIEEPPKNTIIILTAPKPDNLLPTIHSRAQKIRFGRYKSDSIKRYLSGNFDIKERNAEFLAGLAEGSIGRAIDLAADDKYMTLRRESYSILKSLFRNDRVSAVAKVNEFVNPRDQAHFSNFLKCWQSFLADMIILKYGKSQNKIVNQDLKPELENLVNFVSDHEVFVRMKSDLKDTVDSLKRNVHIRPAVSALVIRFEKYISQLNQSA
jgi:DNA polymerase-3 subunit delta'